MGQPIAADHAHAAAHAAHAAEHGHGHGHGHGHVIVPLWLLRSILGALLFFTLLTVGLAQAEVWLGEVFHIALPHWLNVAVALSIAAVKTVLVVTFFMQLRYDNPLNTMVLIFTILTVAFFLGFTALDLGQRGTLDRQKAKYVIDGGTGVTGVNAKGSVSEGVANTPITEAAILAAKNKGKFDPHKAHGHGHGHGGADRGPLQSITSAGYSPIRPQVGSSSMISRPVRGVTLPGFAAPEASHDHDHHAGEKHQKSETSEKGDAKPAAQTPAH